MTNEYGTKYDTEVNLDGNSSHALIVDLVGYEKRVLDVGASTGYLDKILKERGCTVTGIELDPEAARQAEEHCDRVIVGNVEDLDLDGELGEQKFDVIVFGDVLEHLRDPLGTLRRFRPFVEPTGYVVASIPNIAHGSVRLALMQGRFEYNRLGLLDDTHLKFFTRESVEQLFKEAGLMVTELRRTRLGIFDTEIEVQEDSVPAEALRAVQEDPEAQTYQFVLTASPLGETGTLPAAIYEKTIYDLNRKLCSLQKAQDLLDIRNKQLAEKNREVTKLTEEVADLNNRLARMVQFGKEEA